MNTEKRDLSERSQNQNTLADLFQMEAAVPEGAKVEESTFYSTLSGYLLKTENFTPVLV